MVLAQKQKYRSMEQDRKPQDKPTHLWAPNLGQRRQEHTMEKQHFFSCGLSVSDEEADKA